MRNSGNDEAVENEIREFEQCAEPQLDLSEAHFLDHPLWECIADGDQPNRHGGVRAHVELAWKHRWQPRLVRLLVCPTGRHRPITFSLRRHGVNTSQVRCVYCDRKLA
jgi:hypothetical protein